MTVKELIENLSKADPNKSIIVYGRNAGEKPFDPTNIKSSNGVRHTHEFEDVFGIYREV